MRTATAPRAPPRKRSYPPRRVSRRLAGVHTKNSAKAVDKEITVAEENAARRTIDTSSANDPMPAVTPSTAASGKTKKRQDETSEPKEHWGTGCVVWERDGRPMDIFGYMMRSWELRLMNSSLSSLEITGTTESQ